MAENFEILIIFFTIQAINFFFMYNFRRQKFEI